MAFLSTHGGDTHTVLHRCCCIAIRSLRLLVLTYNASMSGSCFKAIESHYLVSESFASFSVCGGPAGEQYYDTKSVHADFQIGGR